MGKGNALDGGAADGLTSAGLANHGWSVVALDISPPLLNLAHQRGVEAVAGDLENSPFRDSVFNLVVCTEVFEHLADYSRAATELRRLTSPGGYAVISIPNPFWEPLFRIADCARMKIPEKTKRLVTKSLIKTAMRECGFENLSEQGVVLWPFSKPKFIQRASLLLEARFPAACATMVFLFRKSGENDLYDSQRIC
jgi:ubiquinone/menaquinone biosynthesis C-methylase UbiE